MDLVGHLASRISISLVAWPISLPLSLLVSVSAVSIYKMASVMFPTVAALCLFFLSLVNAQPSCNNQSSLSFYIFMRYYKLKFDIAASPFPLLIDATTESLETGLESGLFTSVDLVNVRFR